jgi:uncharacterized secreted repeat protein (TIGR03808 family)
MLDRRGFLKASAGFSVLGLTIPAGAAAGLGTIDRAAIRGSLAATEVGLRPDALDDQSKAFQRMLDEASQNDAPLFLPPGAYNLSNITLPRAVRLSGVPGATRIVYGGDGHLLAAEDAAHIELAGLVLDGANRWLGDHVQGLIEARRVAHLVIDNCRLTGSGKNGVSLERVSGRIERSEISGAAEAGVYSVEAGRLQIAGNAVSDCGNGGILVHRWQPADDGTSVSGNRVERIGARAGGTGQYGNGINVFRANGVAISNNRVADCAFSAIRSNSGGNVSITGNTCLRSGETAVYSEFAFEGALIASNILDRAANGISIVNFDQGGRLAVCSGNIVRNLSRSGPYAAAAPGFGIGIVVEADVSVSGNVVENAPVYGLQLGWGPYLRNVVATGNVIRNAGEGVAVSVVEGAGAAIISDNVIDGAPGGAIVGHRWAEAVTGDLARSGADAYAHLTVERNHVS